MAIRNVNKHKSFATENDWWVWILMFLLPRREWYREHYLRSRHWRSIRLQKFDSVSGWAKCNACGVSMKSLDVHHLTYERIWHERLGDLQLLCRECHKKEHS